jgi:hypothetical protein
MNFKRYQHVTRYGEDGVVGVEVGECYIFPKLDGTNASLWWNPDVGLQAGSRNRLLSLENDNAGFLKAMLDQEWFKFFSEHPGLRLFGEWLVPHTLKTYRGECWETFYVFDVMKEGQYLHYNQYKEILDQYDFINYVEPIKIIKNGTYEHFVHEVERNNYLIKDGEGAGEGVVIKNYDFVNKFGDQLWAKIVRSEFKEMNYREHGVPGKEIKMIEESICNEFCTQTLIDKTYDKIRVEKDGWTSRYIPELLGRVYHDLVTEEIWAICKKHKNPRIDFKILQRFVTLKIKELRSELF